jgi:hypothetical protein
VSSPPGGRDARDHAAPDVPGNILENAPLGDVQEILEHILQQGDAKVGGPQHEELADVPDLQACSTIRRCILSDSAASRAMTSVSASTGSCSRRVAYQMES